MKVKNPFAQELGRMGGVVTAKRHGPEFFREIGKKGGSQLAAKRGKEFYRAIGKKGGDAVAKKGREYFAAIGKKGGSKTSATRGPEFYSELGKKGGGRLRELVAKAKKLEGESKAPVPGFTIEKARLVPPALDLLTIPGDDNGVFDFTTDTWMRRVEKEHPDAQEYRCDTWLRTPGRNGTTFNRYVFSKHDRNHAVVIVADLDKEEAK